MGNGDRYVNASKSDGSDGESKYKRESGPATAQAHPASSIAADKRANLYTNHAQEAVNAAELITSALKKHVVGKAVARRVEVAPPSGPSTSGGKKARQSITLVQPVMQGPAVMIGFLDVVQKSAGIREYELVAKHYEARFHLAFETTKEEYQALTKELVGMLSTLGYKLVPDERREDERSVAPEPEDSNRRPLFIAAGVVLAALLLLLLTRC